MEDRRRNASATHTFGGCCQVTEGLYKHSLCPFWNSRAGKIRFEGKTGRGVREKVGLRLHQDTSVPGLAGQCLMFLTFPGPFRARLHFWGAKHRMSLSSGMLDVRKWIYSTFIFGLYI